MHIMTCWVCSLSQLLSGCAVQQHAKTVCFHSTMRSTFHHLYYIVQSRPHMSQLYCRQRSEARLASLVTQFMLSISPSPSCCCALQTEVTLSQAAQAAKQHAESQEGTVAMVVDKAQEAAGVVGEKAQQGVAKAAKQAKQGETAF